MKLFSKHRTKNRQKEARRKNTARRLRMEAMEDRRLMAVDFGNVGAGLQSEFNAIAQELSSIQSTVDLPLTDAAFDVIGSHAGNQLRDAATTIGNQLNQLGKTANASHVRANVAAALQQLTDQPVAANDIQVTFSNNNDDVEIAFQLDTRSVSTPMQHNFALGIDQVLNVRSQNDVQLTSHVIMDVTAGVRNQQFYFDTQASDELRVHLQGDLTGDIDVDMGFLELSATASNPNPELNAELIVDVNGRSIQSRLDGELDVRLAMEGRFAGAASHLLPSAGGELRFGWEFNNVSTSNALSAFGTVPTASIDDVWIDAGEYLSAVLGPLVSEAQKFTRPLQPFVDTFTSPIPGISDLSNRAGLGDVTLLTLMGHLEDHSSWRPSSTGETIFQGESVLGATAKLVRALEIINDIEASPGGLRLHLGSFNLAGSQNQDLRLLGAANRIAVGVASEIGLEDAFNAVVNSGVGDLAEKAGLARSFMADATYNLNVEFPLIENPAAELFQLFVGQHADLVKLTGNWKDSWSERVPLFEFYGVTLGLGGELDVDAHFEIGFDTAGLVAGSQFLDGLYVGADSHLDVAARLYAYVGSDLVVFNAELQGSVETNPSGISITLHDPNHDGKVRIGESSKLFELEGHLAAALSVVVEVGVELPFIGHVGPRFEHELARHVLLDARRDIADVSPWTPPPSPTLGVMMPGASKVNDTLHLTVGQLGIARRGATFQAEDESFRVEHASGTPGNESVVVTAFGFRQQFDGVRHIVAAAGDGDDTIEIAANVLSPVTLSGEAGDDRLLSYGSGQATIEGGLGDDVLESGVGVAHVTGGDGDDTIEVGRGAGYFMGGGGNDRIHGGMNAAVLVGGEGNDELLGGQQHDRIYGGPDNDTIEIGRGGAVVYPGSGTNDVNWQVGDGSATIDEAGVTKVNVLGGSANDRAVVTASNGEIIIDVVSDGETIAIKDLFGQYQGDDENGPYEPTPELQLNFSGEAGSDTLEVEDMTGTLLTTVSANLHQVRDPDGVPDQVVLHGGSQRDLVLVEQTAFWDRGWNGPPEGRPLAIYGGVMSVSGLPGYVAHIANDRDQLTLKTGDGGDVVTLAGTTGPTTVHSEAGDDTIRMLSVQNTDQLGVVSVDAGSGVNQLVLDYTSVPDKMTLSARPGRIHGVIDDVANKRLYPVNLTYSASGGGYSDVTLKAGQHDDRVILFGALTAGSTSLQGGAGNDLFQFAGTTYGSSGQGIFDVNGNDGIDRILAPNRNNEWQVRGTNAGAVNQDIVFRDVEKLSGGSRDDRYVIDPGAEVSIVHGGGGTNTLDYSGWSQPVEVNLRLRKASSVTSQAVGVQHVIGGRGDDLLVGGLGDETLDGREGNDVLIGHGGRDVLFGRAGRDLLIGDSTPWDLNMLALRQLRSDWLLGVPRTPQTIDDQLLDEIFSDDEDWVW